MRLNGWFMTGFIVLMATQAFGRSYSRYRIEDADPALLPPHVAILDQYLDYDRNQQDSDYVLAVVMSHADGSKEEGFLSLNCREVDDGAYGGLHCDINREAAYQCVSLTKANGESANCPTTQPE